MTAGGPDRFPTGVTIARVLAVGRWLCWAWMAALVVVADNRSVDPEAIRPDDPSGPASALRHPVLAWMAVAAVLAVAIWATTRLRSDPGRALSPRFAAVEVVLALALAVLDGLVFDPGHVFATSQSLATQYPVIALGSAGLVFGPWIAASMGVLVGPAEWWGAVLNDFDDWSLRHTFSIVATSLFFAAVGALSGWLGRVLQRVERRIADQRARDEVAGVLHDTVLQTLALVERRTAGSDPELATAARRADVELRSFLFGAGGDRDLEDLESRVRTVVESAHARLDLDRTVRSTVNVLDLGVEAPPRAIDGLVAALGESVVNALEHAQASHIVVFVETDDDGQVTASVRDDGAGFDLDAALASDRRGLRHSIIGRLESVGGSVRITSNDEGTEVLLSTTSVASVPPTGWPR